MDKHPRTVIYGEAVKKAIIEGVTTAYKAVGTTLGSKGLNVSIEKNWGVPLIIHDGVTVARELVLSNPYANMAAQQVIAAAQDTNNQAGDGTTTVTIITYAMVIEGLKHIAAGVHPQVIRKGIEKAVEVVTTELKAMATSVKTSEEIQQIASISAASKDIGKLIAATIEKVGEHGLVSVQEGNSDTIQVEYKEGMEFSQGRISPYLVTDFNRPENDDSEMKNPVVVLINDVITNSNLVEILVKINALDTNTRALIIAQDFEPDALSLLVANRVRANKIYIGVKAPEFGEHRTQMLHDIARVTGATVIGGSSGQGIAYDSVTADHFGRAEKVIVNRNETMIIGGKGDKKELQHHVTGIKRLLQAAKTQGEKDKIEARLAKLIAGVSVISVGANSETERRELKERINDAVNATQAAVEMGIVPGGGVALVRASKRLAIFAEKADDELVTGIKIVQRALLYPLIKLVKNSGADSGFVVETILRSTDKNHGYNVDSEQFENMIESGIIDPVKVTLSAFKNACSTATMLLTTDCMIAFERENQKKEAGQIEGVGSFAD